MPIHLLRSTHVQINKGSASKCDFFTVVLANYVEGNCMGNLHEVLSCI